ncbi:MAG: tail protein X, partial [Prevotella melaninogenica]
QHAKLDAILYRHFGRSEGLLEIPCELNPHLMDKPIIPIGNPVILPDADKKIKDVRKQYQSKKNYTYCGLMNDWG